MESRLKVLIVEDNPNDAELLTLALEQGGFQVEAERVDTAEDFLNELNRRKWDVIFSDHTMPHFNSFEALNIRNGSGKDIPFIILSGTMGEDVAVEAMKAGANDYFVKGRLARLLPALNRELQDAREREIRRKIEWELEHFVASLTHDLRTPLTAEYRVLEQLKEGGFGALTPEQREVVEELLDSNRFVQHMVNNILFAYKYKQHNIRLNKEPTDLAHLIGSLTASPSIQVMLKERPHELVTEPVDFIPPVEVDRNELQRVLLNLIKNAVDYTPRGGTITLSLKWEENYVRVSVQDTGPGLDPEIEPHLFTPYASAAGKKYRQLGLGLGLYLSKQIIEAHGGKIGYEKKEDGSLFYFELPAAVSQVSAVISEQAGAKQGNVHADQTA